MKILVVSAHFHPFTHPRAHRWTEIAAEWTASGHEVHIVTARFPGAKSGDAFRGATVHRAGFASLKEAFNHFFPGKIQRGELAAGPRPAGFLTKLLAFFNDLFWRPFYWPDDAALWFFPARRLAARLLSCEKFDAVVTVSLPFTGHLVGLSIKKKFPKIRWLADVGDPIAFQRFPLQNPFFYGKLTRFYEKKVLLAADWAAVTNSGLAELYQKNYGVAAGKIHVLPPIASGRGEVSASTFSRKRRLPRQVGFFGSFFRGVREPDVLVRFIESIPENRRRLFRFHVFGPVFHEFERKLAGVPNLELHGPVSRDRVFSVMAEMDFLLNIGNTEPHQLPSKIADYLVSGRPILNLCQTRADAFAREAAGHPYLKNVFWEDGKFLSEWGEEVGHYLLLGPPMRRRGKFFQPHRHLRWFNDYLEEQSERFSARRIAQLYLDLIFGQKKTATR